MTRVADDLRAVTLVPGAGHWIQQEKPAETNAFVLEFLKGLKQ
jgi:pimeloyl-ACP methyl ester carboxylesterase